MVYSFAKLLQFAAKQLHNYCCSECGCNQYILLPDVTKEDMPKTIPDNNDTFGQIQCSECGQRWLLGFEVIIFPIKLDNGPRPE